MVELKMFCRWLLNAYSIVIIGCASGGVVMAMFWVVEMTFGKV